MRTVPLLAFLLFSLTSCSEPPPPPVEEVPRPVKTMVIPAPEGGGIRRFPARIDAAHKAQLAFRVPGKVIELAVKEGDEVEKDQLIAKLDPTDYQLRVDERRADFENARKNYERAKQLIEKGNISKMDYDRLEARFRTTKAALDAAEQELSYTALRAPFDGIVARRYIQPFEEIRVQQPIVDLQDITTLEVKFDVPESIIRSLQTSSEKPRGQSIALYAEFDGMSGQTFPLRYKEAATKADPKTQTFEITYLMDRPEHTAILPGMTATVVVDLSHYLQTKPVVSVPVSAVVGNIELQPEVWVVDEESMTVNPRPVQVGRMTKDMIQIVEGVEPGMRIVTAGTSFLVQGMKVTLMEPVEQAAPRGCVPY